MTGEITFTPSGTDYADAHRDCFLARLRRPGPWLRLAGFVLICAVLGAVTTYLDGRTDEMGVTALGLGLLGLFAILLICLSYFLTLPLRARRLYRQNKLHHQPWTYGWSEAGLDVASANGRSLYPWRDFHRWLIGRRTILLFLNDQLFLYLPRRKLDDRVIEEIRTLVAGAGVPRV